MNWPTGSVSRSLPSSASISSETAMTGFVIDMIENGVGAHRCLRLDVHDAQRRQHRNASLRAIG
jgi:hypothetical protein